jgi:phosphoglycolate phosphatase-like HAD superfamily hydrolase
MDANARRTPYRLVALDIDGTVLDSAQQVSAELKAALARLAARDAGEPEVPWHGTEP